MPTFRYFTTRPGAFFKSLQKLTAREQKHLTSEIVKVRGLMPLLMKQRNDQRWTREERQELAAHLRRLSTISPYLVVLALPGGAAAIAQVCRRTEERERGMLPRAPV